MPPSELEAARAAHSSPGGLPSSTGRGTANGVGTQQQQCGGRHGACACAGSGSGGLPVFCSEHGWCGSTPEHRTLPGSDMRPFDCPSNGAPGPSLKDGPVASPLPPPAPTERQPAPKCVAAAFMSHTELRGDEYEHSEGKAKPEDCCDQCTRNPKCGGFTYNSEEKFCRFKTHLTKKLTVHTECDICWSWVKDRAYMDVHQDCPKCAPAPDTISRGGP
jgi:hypothetical protein